MKPFKNLPDTGSQSRQHHFDALRGFAMLLGIGLHASLSLAGVPWIVIDNTKSDWLKWFFESIHGFRMQLFFVVSGYFTMLLYRRRGLSSLLEQRFQRVLVPCLLGLVTVIPLQQWISVRAADNAPKREAPLAVGKVLLIEAIRKRDAIEFERLLSDSPDLNKADAEFGIPPLGWAALYGDALITKRLLDRGADVNSKDRDGYRPLHQAAFLGRSEVVPLLLERGADSAAKGKAGETAKESAAANWQVTQFLAGILRVPIGSEQEMREGRTKAILALDKHESAKVESVSTWETVKREHRELQKSYREFLTSQRWTIRMSSQGPPYHPILTGEFAHLWFLWFLCWFVVLFGIGVKVVQYTSVPRIPAGLILSRFRILWLVPLTMIPQVFMGVFGAGFGPDTSTGVIPQPHLLVYYGIFFAVGTIYYDSQDLAGRLGRRWWMWLPVAGGVFAYAKDYDGSPLIAGSMQILYAWTMIFGFIGLFRQVLGREFRFVRYLADSAYWLYLIHLPLVIYLQSTAREWQYSPYSKFVGISLIATAVPLLSYQIFVRHSYLGTILNGLRIRK